MDDEARDTIESFHEAFNRRDLDALGDLITDDCVFEATSPAPDGTPVQHLKLYEHNYIQSR